MEMDSGAGGTQRRPLIQTWSRVWSGHLLEEVMFKL